MRAVLLTAVLLLSCCAVWAAEPAATVEDLMASSVEDFEENTALGAVLETRDGTAAELDQLEALASRGLATARKVVARAPDSAEGQYLLGSWLLYGYDVEEVERVSFDPDLGERTQTVRQAVVGLADDPDEGLAALKRAATLAPDRGDYLVDYAIALADYGRQDEARSIFKKLWAGEPKVDVEQRTRAGMLLSDMALLDGKLDEAREWLYSALSLNPLNAPFVERLRHLDAARAAQNRAELAAALEAWQQYEEEWGEEEQSEWSESETDAEEEGEEGYEGQANEQY